MEGWRDGGMEEANEDGGEGKGRRGGKGEEGEGEGEGEQSGRKANVRRGGEAIRRHYLGTTSFPR